MPEKIFVDGLFAKKRQGAPEFVVSSISVKVPEFINFLNKHQNNAGYVNIDMLLSQNGTQYCVLNTWKPNDDKVKQEENNQSKLNNFTKDDTVPVEPERIIDPANNNDLTQDDEIPF